MFESINQLFQLFSQWVSGIVSGFTDTFAPTGPGTRMAPPVPAAIENFRHAATTPGRDQDWMMGELKDQGISPYDFGKFCSGFAEGVDYIYRKYGTSPNGIVIVDMPERMTTFYNHDNQAIFVSRQWIGRALHQYATVQGKTDPQALLPLQMAIMYGVEEAFHHYQFSVQGDKYIPLMDSYRNWRQDPDAYRNHPVEVDAQREVQEAMKAYGMDQMPVAPMFDDKWQKMLAERQAQAQMQPQTGTPVRA